MIDAGKDDAIKQLRHELMTLITNGVTIQDAAAGLGIEFYQAGNHLERLKKWNKCRTTYELVALAVKTGYVIHTGKPVLR